METGTVESLGFPVDTAVCFSDHRGTYKKGAEKQQMKLLRKAAPVLRTLLRPGEKVLLAVPACSPMSFMEQWTTGWAIYYIKRCLLIVTDRRILELAAKRDLSPRPSITEIEHAGVAEAKVATFLGRSIKLRYRSGRTDQFPQLDSKVAARLKALLPSLVGQGATATPGGRQHLCPRCANRLPAADRCSHCFLEFKTRAKAIKYALIFPGGGYFYTGHPVLGAFDAMVELFLCVLVLGALLDTVAGKFSADTAAALIVFGVGLAVEKAVSVYHAQHYVKEYLPADGDVTPIKAA